MTTPAPDAGRCRYCRRPGYLPAGAPAPVHADTDDIECGGTLLTDYTPEEPRMPNRDPDEPVTLDVISPDTTAYLDGTMPAADYFTRAAQRARAIAERDTARALGLDFAPTGPTNYDPATTMTTVTVPIRHPGTRPVRRRHRWSRRRWYQPTAAVLTYETGKRPYATIEGNRIRRGGRLGSQVNEWFFAADPDWPTWLRGLLAEHEPACTADQLIDMFLALGPDWLSTADLATKVGVPRYAAQAFLDNLSDLFELDHDQGTTDEHGVCNPRYRLPGHVFNSDAAPAEQAT